jgi:hypothetical protein
MPRRKERRYLERHVLKPELIFKGEGLKPVAFKLWVSRAQLAPAPPWIPPPSESSPGCSGAS